MFGYALDQYETLFEEKLELFAALRAGGPVSWQGTVRPPLQAQNVFPAPERGTLATWVGVGGSPQSVVRAAHYRLPMMLAIIGGAPGRFRPYVELYARALAELGAPALPVGVHSPGHVGETDAAAAAAFWPAYKAMHDRIGGERGWPPMARAAFDREVANGSLYVGSPDTVARKIAATAQALGLARFDLKYSAGPLSHEAIMSCIALYGREVIPRVRALLA